MRKSQYFPFFNVKCQTRELTGTIFITSLVWRGPWLGIEPGTSRTRCEHSTTRLSRRHSYPDSRPYFKLQPLQKYFFYDISFLWLYSKRTIICIVRHDPVKILIDRQQYVNHIAPILQARVLNFYSNFSCAFYCFYLFGFPLTHSIKRLIAQKHHII